MIEKELILASNNRHKAIEIAEALPGYVVRTPSALGLDFYCEEDGETFLDNALKKARVLHRLCGRPVLADDSGLCVAALDGKPGVLSARFGHELPSPPRNDAERNAYLLSLLPRGRDSEAFFACALVLLVSPYRFFVAQETVAGRIVFEARGASGFGYDPIFYIPEKGKTIAEMSLEEKNSFSHRGRAARLMRAVLDQA